MKHALLYVALALTWPGTSLVAGDGLLAAHKILRMDGSCSLRQTLDGQVLDDSSFQLRQILIPKKVDPSGNQVVLLARELKGPDSFSTMQLFRLGADGLVKRRHEFAVESKKRALQATVFFPLTFPTFELSPAEGKAKKTEINLLQLTTLDANLLAKSEKNADAQTLTVSRSLEPGSKPRFDFQGLPSELVTWEEEYVYDLAAKTLRKAHMNITFVATTADGKVQLDSKSSTKLVTVVDAREAGITAGLGEFGRLQKMFQSRVGSEPLTPAVEKFTKTVQGGVLDVLAGCEQARLQDYIQLFELDPAGPRLAKLFDHQAPDFKLDGLDDKEVSFRELSKGKFTLLTFWGFG